MRDGLALKFPYWHEICPMTLERIEHRDLVNALSDWLEDLSFAYAKMKSKERRHEAAKLIDQFVIRCISVELPDTPPSYTISDKPATVLGSIAEVPITCTHVRDSDGHCYACDPPVLASSAFEHWAKSSADKMRANEIDAAAMGFAAGWQARMQAWENRKPQAKGDGHE